MTSLEGWCYSPDCPLRSCCTRSVADFDGHGWTKETREACRDYKPQVRPGTDLMPTRVDCVGFTFDGGDHPPRLMKMVEATLDCQGPDPDVIYRRPARIRKKTRQDFLDPDFVQQSRIQKAAEKRARRAARRANG